jgi:hypothetical protein
MAAVNRLKLTFGDKPLQILNFRGFIGLSGFTTTKYVPTFQVFK